MTEPVRPRSQIVAARTGPAARARSVTRLAAWSGSEAPAIVWRAKPKPQSESAAPSEGVAPAAAQAAVKPVAPMPGAIEPARPLTARSAAKPALQLDPVIAERLAQDVMRRIERKLRIGRERRGI